MKVFISWSGLRSRAVAEALHRWLPLVIQEIDPFLSSRDIDKGARWLLDLSRELETTELGILCLTPDNLEAPWLLFEAGALSKRAEESRVIPFLFGLNRADVPTASPLGHIQSTVYEREDVAQMLATLNDRCAHPLAGERLAMIFAQWWPALDEELRSIERDERLRSKSPLPPRDRDLLAEILDVVRGHQRDISDLRTELPGLGAAWAPSLGLNRIAGWADRLREMVSAPSFRPPPRGSIEEFELLHALFHDEMARTLGRKPTIDEMRDLLDRFWRESAPEQEAGKGTEPTPAFRTIAEFAGVDVVALREFGGDIDDPVAAAIKVNRYTVVQVVAPAARSGWDQETEARFRGQVRSLARTHPLLGREGAVSVLFDPPDTSTDDGTQPGEPVERP